MRPLIINTRPARQAEELTRLLTEADYKVVDFPLIEIKKNLSNKQLLVAKDQLAKAELLIFISANAVIYFFENSLGLVAALPKSIKTAVIGKSTAEIFQQYSARKADIIPSAGSDSESLLKHPYLENIKNNNIIIIRGQGGREYLAQQLKLKGAKVSYLEVYQRVCPQISQIDEKSLHELWHKQSIGFMIITSVESLNNFLEIGCKQAKLYKLAVKQTNLLVIHKKIKQKAIEYGFTGKIIVSEQANNLSILKALRNVNVSW